MDLYSELEWRGLIHSSTDGLSELLGSGKKPATYVGFDPTAPSLHVGSLLPMVVLARVREFGHEAIALVGGGTGLIGDPSGKTAERALQTTRSVTQNVRKIEAQLKEILRRAHDIARKHSYSSGQRHGVLHFENNADWLRTLRAIKLMRDVGKHFTVNWMLAKDSIQRRLQGDSGISYTEFSYLLLQAYDFLQLFDQRRCTLQVGGSDQWGNITAGTELIRRTRNAKAHGLVFPLLTSATGHKFGKTEAGAVWLDRKLTGWYEFFQFWLNTDDRDAVKYLKFFTFLTRERIAELEAATARAPEQRQAQRELAREVTRLVHGDEAVREAEAASATLFSEKITDLTLGEIRRKLANVPSFTVAVRLDGWSAVDLLAEAGVTRSKSQATQLIRGGGIYVNDRRIKDERARLSLDQAIEGQVFVVRRGKKDNFLIHIRRG